jgi:hypothetical protein
MSAYPDPHLGLAIGQFWQQMERAVADVLENTPPVGSNRLDPAHAPKIVLADGK